MLQITIAARYRFPFLACAVLLWSLQPSAPATEAASPRTCSLTLPVYGPTGEQLPFEVIRAAPESRPDINLLAVPNADHRMIAHGQEVLFPEKLIGKGLIEFSLRGSKGKTLRTKIGLMSCRQRTSLVGEFGDTLRDTAWEIIRGRLAGCTFSEEWWVRAVPMFGAQNSPFIPEGGVAKDGTFEVAGEIRGERYLLVIGAGKQPLKVIGLNVREGVAEDAGIVDLKGACGP